MLSVERKAIQEFIYLCRESGVESELVVIDNFDFFTILVYDQEEADSGDIQNILYTIIEKYDDMLEKPIDFGYFFSMFSNKQDMKDQIQENIIENISHKFDLYREDD